MSLDEAHRMSSFFSAYRPSPWNVRRLLKLAPAGCLALAVWGAIIQAVPSSAAPTLLLVGGILWGCSMLSGFLRARTIALVLVVSGAVLIGTGIFVQVVLDCGVPHSHQYPDGSFVLDCCCWRGADF